MIRPSLDEFVQLAESHEVIPVFREILADTETPVSAFRRVSDSQHGALLESMEGGERWGRYSIIGCDPWIRFECRGRRWWLKRLGGRSVRSGPARGKTGAGRDGRAEPEWDEEGEEDRPLMALDRLLGCWRAARVPELPDLAGGAIGFVSYDAARRFERLPEIAEDELRLPDARFVLFRAAVVFDHRSHTVKAVVNAWPGEDAAGSYREAGLRIEELTRALQAGRSPDALEGGARATARPRPNPMGFGLTPGEELPPLPVASTMSRAEYAAAVERAREYIRAGDVVQVVLAHRLQAPVTSHPFDVYRALRVINPSPYLFYLQLGEIALVGSSPEVLVRRTGTRLETRPIAGTRPRGRTDEEDHQLEGDLLASQKERAEHVMLVDLGRNDLGRLCAFGTVGTSEFMSVERYSHVMHLVSHVHGDLRGSTTNAEVLEACFPAGTVSGAPKIRAMEIIEEMEPVRRGTYAGAVGYLDFHGNMDTCIAIRTLLFQNGQAYLGVGAGIVADSDPEAEYEETLRKGSALLRACELAEAGLHRFSRLDSARPQGTVPRREGSP